MVSTIQLYKHILDTARLQRRRIAIGIHTVTPRIVESLTRATEYVDVVVVGQHIDGFECVKSSTPEPMIQMARNKEVDGVVRGNFDALDAYNALKTVLNMEENIFELNFFKLNGINMIDEGIENVFAFLPGSFVNDRTMLDKIKNIDMHISFFQKLHIEPRIGILGPGKPIDVLDGVEEVNAGLAEAAFLEKWYNDKGIWATYFNHQIEYAVQEANIVVAQNSWAGNLGAHCLLYLGNVDFLGGVGLNIAEFPFVDDSEAMQDFTSCLIFAAFLANSGMYSS